MIIYLDQNKWIELARMAYGKDNSARAKRVLRDFEFASNSGHVEIPLSSFHYVETSRISNVDRKVRLGTVMWRFSKGVTIIGYSAVVRHELESALAKHFSQITVSNISILGRGHAHAFCAPPLKGVLAHIEEEVERSLLIGNEVLGIKPPASHSSEYRENFREHLATLHSRQKEVPKELHENWLYAMSTIDILKPINDTILKHGIPKEALNELGEQKLKEIIEDMPTRSVDLHLHKQVLRNPSYRARTTDLEDWGSLAIASSYCDVVVCEKHMADMLKRDGFRTYARVEVNLENTFTLLRGA